MGSNYRNKMTYEVDIVFCIDATMSMEPILSTVKAKILNFYQDVMEKMNEKNKKVSQLRTRIIAFRDYYYDRENAMLVTNFFKLPEMSEDLEACVKSIIADGGGDDPEDGFEALAYAMKSEWSMGSAKKRQIIVVWSDDGTHDLGFGKSAPNYPKNMPKDFNELTEWWGSKKNPGLMDEQAKRLLIFAPDKPGWSTIRENWNNVIQVETEVGKGMEEFEYSEILDVICNSI